MSPQRKNLFQFVIVFVNLILTVCCVNNVALASQTTDENITKLISQLSDLSDQFENLDIDLPNKILNGLEHKFAHQTQSEDAVSERIIGGFNASRGEYREFALVLIIDSQFNIVGSCGGSLIGFTKVLTAAHCSLESAAEYVVIPEFYSFNDQLSQSDISFVSRVRTHPNYNDQTADNDIGILTLTDSFFSPQANIHAGSNLFKGTLGTSIGTGLIATDPPQVAAVLQEVVTPIVSNEQCSAAWLKIANIDPITDRMMCAGFALANRGTCNGDSGAGLFVDIKGERTLVGTTSFGLVNCEANGEEQVYARVSTMTDFILSESPSTRFIFSDTQVPPLGALFLLLGGDESSDSLIVPDPQPEPGTLNPAIAEFNDGLYQIAMVIDPTNSFSGINYLYTPQNSNLQISRTDNGSGISVRINGASFETTDPSIPDEWAWNFEVASGEFRTGIFSDVTSYPSNSGNGLTVSNRDQGCSTFTGQFRVFEVEFSGDDVTKLIADYEYTCQFSGVRRASIHFDKDNNPANYESILVATEPELSVQAPISAGGTIRIESEDGDSLGQGENYLLNNSNADFTASVFGSLSGVTIIAGADRFSEWSFSFQRGSLDIDPDKDLPLSVGLYENAFISGVSQPFPGLKITSPGRGCVNSTGEFRVFEIEFNAFDELVKFIADFSHSCGDSSEPKLKGTIHFDLTLPLL